MAIVIHSYIDDANKWDNNDDDDDDAGDDCFQDILGEKKNNRHECILKNEQHQQLYFILNRERERVIGNEKKN